jgi:type IV pilus assembly protein PilM
VCDNQQQLLADACELIPHERALNQPGAQPEQVAIVRRSLQSLLARHDLTGTRVGVSLSATRVLARLLRLPRSKSKVRSEIVAYEARHVLPFALNELVWDFQPLQPSEGDSPGDEGERVLLLAAKSWDANQRAAAFQDCGLEIDVMQSDTAALHNLMGFELSAAPEGAEAGGAAGLLDVGAAASNLVIACQDVVWFRSIGLGGDDFTQKLVRDLRLTRLQAEQAKREPFRARVISRLYESLQPVSSQLAAELRLSLDAFAKAYPNHRVRAIYGVGGGFQLHGLLRHLQRGF